MCMLSPMLSACWMERNAITIQLKRNFLQVFALDKFRSFLLGIKVTKEFPPGLSKSQKDKLRVDAKYYFWDTPYLWKFCVDQVVRRCVPQDEFHPILFFFSFLFLWWAFWNKKNGPQGT